MSSIFNFFSVILWIIAGLFIITMVLIFFERVKRLIGIKFTYWKLRITLREILRKLKLDAEPDTKLINQIEELIENLNEHFKLKNLFNLGEEDE